MTIAQLYRTLGQDINLVHIYEYTPYCGKLEPVDELFPKEGYDWVDEIMLEPYIDKSIFRFKIVPHEDAYALVIYLLA